MFGVISTVYDESNLQDIVQLVVPLHMIASVGYVREDSLNIVTLRIGEIDGNADIYDLAIFYTKTAVSLDYVDEFPVDSIKERRFSAWPKRFVLSSAAASSSFIESHSP